MNANNPLNGTTGINSITPINKAYQGIFNVDGKVVREADLLDYMASQSGGSSVNSGDVVQYLSQEPYIYLRTRNTTFYRNPVYFFMAPDLLNDLGYDPAEYKLEAKIMANFVVSGTAPFEMQLEELGTATPVAGSLTPMQVTAANSYERFESSWFALDSGKSYELAFQRTGGSSQYGYIRYGTGLHLRVVKI